MDILPLHVIIGVIIQNRNYFINQNESTQCTSRQKENKMRKNLTTKILIVIILLKFKDMLFVLSIIDEYKGYLIKWKYIKYDKNVYFLRGATGSFRSRTG